jgi:Zn-dependent peptidase ImmA (M78 family)
MLNPDRVELVRLRLGLTKTGLAQQLGVDRKTIQRFETGEFDLPSGCLERLCTTSGYPKEFFGKAAFAFPGVDGVSFRSLRSLTSRSRDAALAAGALAFELDDWIAARYELPDHSLVQIENRAPEESAAFLRARWGIGERPIGNMINLLESRGVRVFSLAEETRHLDAYSFWRDDKPYIFLNTLKTAEHSRYDAAHELGHLVMHRHSGSAHSNAENEANSFASAFLMPAGDVKAEMPRVRSLDDLIVAKRRWGVSAAALNYRLHKLGRISDWNYRGHYIALGQIGREIEPNGIERETSQVWTKVLTDLWTQGISLSRIAEDLKIPERELNGLLFGIAAAQPHVPRASPPGSLRLVTK